ncbi:MAG: hypothetical protein KBT61_02035 [Paraperlucidibaca sp.]|jgi:hypothetical protein|uniref:hypothetical protein n=1 Tax=Paraperlucidibaca sp. TaxID=2708021 RepID=UPI001B64B3E8|nr:hypothetical protein [Paraperlucidibaca sp.]MBQ0841721.1 hypothetical protein [Paraperlucidibaca sp.]|tara:strand:- start:208 stop:1812 length:1605 start_codon:yes stop_codon:yes gene_type:complete
MQRRTFIQAGAGLAVGPILGGCSDDQKSISNSPSSRTGYQPKAARLQSLVEKMVSFGPRLTGSDSHKRFIDYLEQEFQALGLSTQRDPYFLTLWEAQRKALSLKTSNGDIDIPVDAYYPRSGPTGEEGVTGPLVYVGAPLQYLSLDLTDVASQQAMLSSLLTQLPSTISGLLASLGSGGVKDAIAIVELPLLPAVAGIFYPFLTYKNDDDFSINPLTDYKRAWLTSLATMAPIVETMKAAGAKGVIFAFDSSAENTAGQYLPFLSGPSEIPALIVNRDTSNQLRALAGKAEATLTLTASVRENVQTDTLVAILPGVSDENIIVNTHTDGQNAFEENGAVACLEVARHYASLPLSMRPRTLVFSLVTGHMAPHMPQANGFIESHPDIMAKATAAVTLEHLGAREWLDDATGYHATGRPEIAALFHSTTPIGLAAIQSMRATKLQRLLLCRPIGVIFFGVGAPFHLAGIPCLAYITGPHYLLAIEPDDGMARFDAVRMEEEMDLALDMLHRIETIPALLLKAGDSAVLGALPLPAL